SLDTPVGRELMTARQVFSEGAFGIIKQDYGYDRLRRRGNSNVSFEIFMVAIGFNIRKYHNMIHKRKPSEESMKCC
ncbi:transposase, partial [Kandleria vitulina]|uniref:transposase n=1 Tax=Kandleria vitulina TaxID=1630 RepID=UPI00055ADE25